nr:4293_t:CDS:2 [Entrophospora candida]
MNKQQFEKNITSFKPIHGFPQMRKQVIDKFIATTTQEKEKENARSIIRDRTGAREKIL